MKHLKVALLSLPALVFLTGTAIASESQQSAGAAKFEPFVEISPKAMQKADRAFKHNISLDISALEVAPAQTVISGEPLDYNDKIDVSLELNETAFMGLVKLSESDTLHTPKGGYPEGVYIEPYTAVAGGGIKTKF